MALPEQSPVTNLGLGAQGIRCVTTESIKVMSQKSINLQTLNQLA